MSNATVGMRPGRSPEATDYLKQPQTSAWSSQGPAGGMLSTARPQAQPGSVTAAVQAMRQGSPMAMDMLRQSAGLPGAQTSQWSSQGPQVGQTMQLGPMQMQGGGFMGGNPAHFGGYRQGAAPSPQPWNPQPMPGGGMNGPAGWGPAGQQFAQQFRQNLWNPMAAGGGGMAMGGPQGPPPSPMTFQQYAQQQPYASGKMTPYGPFVNPQSPASLFRQQQLLAQYYGMQPGF